MADFSQLANVQFYAGKPDTVFPDKLIWKDNDFEMSLVQVNGELVATMTGGNCEWKTKIDRDNLKESIDAALQDACMLGRAANWSNDE